MESQKKPQSETIKPPTVLDGMIKPGFPGKVFTTLFFKQCMVFCKTGSISTDTAGTMRASLGGYTGKGLVTGAIGTLVDSHTRKKRVGKAATMASWEPQDIVASHKRNFLLEYDKIDRIETKGPNFADELRIRIYTPEGTFKFRMNNQSKGAAKYVLGVLNEFMPGKVNP